MTARRDEPQFDVALTVVFRTRVSFARMGPEHDGEEITADDAIANAIGSFPPGLVEQFEDGFGGEFIGADIKGIADEVDAR